MRTVDIGGEAVAPSKILCVGRNYVAHIEELGNEVPAQMVVFIKPNSAIGDTLHAARDGEPLHYEGELAFAVQGGRFAAVGFGLDLTRRALQGTLKDKGLPWERAKAFDGAALFSNFVPLPGEPDGLALRLEIDGAVRQAGDVALMIHKPADILRELQSFTTLEDGDIVMTGTPAGVGEVAPGQHFRGSVLAGQRPLVAANWRAR